MCCMVSTHCTLGNCLATVLNVHFRACALSYVQGLGSDSHLLSSLKVCAFISGACALVTYVLVFPDLSLALDTCSHMMYYDQRDQRAYALADDICTLMAYALSKLPRPEVHTSTHVC